MDTRRPGNNAVSIDSFAPTAFAGAGLEKISTRNLGRDYVSTGFIFVLTPSNFLIPSIRRKTDHQKGKDVFKYDDEGDAKAAIANAVGEGD
ncbi:hypothetical protein NLJ89_g3303 [Agrocybe chaxingu]|uniref:Uncharacterized protein n=1 Tax=Agrocybe chaxingu TaxID=84603 RepID=A0A9W8K5W0_9AGAR|nr:hypothetical protein NLJ89_g3303 [Agrocybe chaxingu]